MPWVYGVAAVVLGAAGAWYWFRSKHDSASIVRSSGLVTDLTGLAGQGKLEKVVVDDALIERLFHILARKQKNNPLLIGEPGVGKTAVVEGLAQKIASGDVPPPFIGKRILALDMAELMAGTKYRGELESRVKALVSELQADARQNILFIDEIHMLEQARGSEGAVDIADVLKPALAHGELHVLGATTWAEYTKYIKTDAALERRFQPVLVEEPSREMAIRILTGVKSEYETFHGVEIPDDSVVAAVDASLKYMKDRFLPDKAFDIIDEACAKVSLETWRREHAASLGLLHEASSRAKTMGSAARPMVTAKDIKEIAKQWHAHHTHPTSA